MQPVLNGAQGFIALLSHEFTIRGLWNGDRWSTALIHDKHLKAIKFLEMQNKEGTLYQYMLPFDWLSA